MNDLTVEILSGLAVLVLGGMGSLFIRSRFIQKASVLPAALKYVEKQTHKHLGGKWHLYWLSFHPSSDQNAYWFHGLQELEVDKNSVKGMTFFDDDSPMPGLSSRLQGEIRAGRMIMTDTCVEDETEFASVIYPNLRSGKLLVGVWSGLDNLLRPVSAPAILSRDVLDSEQLNAILHQSTITLIPVGEYDFHPEFGRETSSAN